MNMIHELAAKHVGVSTLFNIIYIYNGMGYEYCGKTQC